MRAPDSAAYPGLKLLPQHEALLRASGIHPEIAKSRGYQSVVDGDEEYLGVCGFTAAQQRLPALLIPIHNVHGHVALYQLRPDDPRTDEQGRVIKYETARKATMALDINPWLRQSTILQNPQVPLIITEGARKVDAGLSKQLVTIGLLGVASWRGTDKTTGGTRALPDWEALSLNNRDVLFGFDSDVIYKKPVHDALGRLSRYLQSFKANVYYAPLPEGTRGVKVGLDDYLAQHTREEFLALKQRERPVFKTAAELTAEEAAAVAAALHPDLVEPLAAIDRLPQYPHTAALLAPMEQVGKVLAQITDPLRLRLAVEETEQRLRAKGLNANTAKHLVGEALATARLAGGARGPAAVLSPEARAAKLVELREQAKDVLAHPDPLQLILEELPHIGYGGEPAPVLIGLLAATTRVLDVFSIPGAAVGHLQYQGPSSAGKTFIVSMVRRFLPPEVWRDAGGSTKSLIYVTGSYAHTVLLFPEMDALPKGGSDDQNVIASAVRGLLSEHRLIYRVVVRVPEDAGGGFETREIDLPGPTVMFTTGLGQLEKQYSTRTFTYKVSAEVDEIVAKLEKAGHNEAARNTREPRPGLLAFQELIQFQAPWDVWVPFADQIARHSAAYTRKNRKVGPRVLRDLNKIFAFVKATTVLNHAHRRQDERGQWVAEITDYAVVYEFVGDLYQEAVTGAEKRIRQVVETVTALVAAYRAKNANSPTAPSWGPNAKQVGEALGLSTPGVTRYIVDALAQGWLVDLDAEAGSEHRGPSRRPYRLVPGDPLPELGALIPPSDLIGLTSPKSAATAGGSDVKPPQAGSSETLIANGQETQAESGAFKRLIPPGGENGGPRREPVRLPEDRPRREPVR